MGMSQGGGQSMLRFLRSKIRLGGWVGSVCHVPTAPHLPRSRDPLLASARPTVNRSRPVRLLAGESDCVFAPGLVEVSYALPRGRNNSSGSEAELLREDLDVSKKSRRKSVLVEASQKVKAISGNERAQQIIDQIANGEDFELNRWRCLETPDRAYYTLGPFAHLELQLVEARRLIPSVSGVLEHHFGDEPDAFVRVYVDDCLQYSTKIINNSRRPKWSDTQTFDIVADSSFIRVHVYDSDPQLPWSAERWGNSRFRLAIRENPESREESLRFDALQHIKEARTLEHLDQVDEENQKIDKTLKVKGVVPASLAQRVMRRVNKGVWGLASVITHQDRALAREDDTVQYNAGEIRLKMKLVRVVPAGMDAFARALQPSYFTYATFVQEEYLPQLDLQEMVDDVLDIKIQLLDDLIFAVWAFTSYIVAWKSFALSGLLLSVVIANCYNELLAWGIFHLWLGIVLVLLSKKRWRDRLSTNGHTAWIEGWELDRLNAPLNQEGLEMVNGRQVHVVFDDQLREGDFDMEEVQPRIQAPAIPRMFVPKSVLGIVATLQYQVFGFHRQLVPFTQWLQDGCILFCQARAIRVIRGACYIVASYFHLRCFGISGDLVATVTDGASGQALRCQLSKQLQIPRQRLRVVDMERPDEVQVVILPLCHGEIHELDPNDFDGTRTPLQAAARLGDTDGALLLLEAGARLDLPDAQGRTPLMLAVSMNMASR
eukprot:g29054.t1